MADRAKSTRTPSRRTPLPLRDEDQSAFRETFLVHFRPADCAALAHVGDLLQDLILDAPLFIAQPAEREPYSTLQAVATDLEYAAGVLASSAELTMPTDRRLAGVIGRWAEGAEQLGEKIRTRLAEGDST